MNVHDVKQIISETHIRKEFIKINDKYLVPGGYYLFYDESSYMWVAFYNDRDYNGEKFFPTEEEACHNFLKLIFSSPENFEDYNIKNYWTIKERGKKLLEKYLVL